LAIEGFPYRERSRAAEADDEPEAIPFLKRFTVFNSDQCADLPADLAPPPAPIAEHLILPQAEALIRATGAGLRIGGDRASYVPSADYIQVPPPAAFFEPINRHRTVCHELGHNADCRIMPHNLSNGWRVPSRHAGVRHNQSASRRRAACRPGDIGRASSPAQLSA
jgi:antirestriction protein ArdC